MRGLYGFPRFSEALGRELSPDLDQAAHALARKCWVLGRIFSSNMPTDHMVFEGGTSLSTAFALIDRFSEDIDLVLDWRVLGYTEHLEAEVSSTLLASICVRKSGSRSARSRLLYRAS
jgi:predicted nucleotidyltransferase component of viral defense system